MTEQKYDNKLLRDKLKAAYARIEALETAARGLLYSDTLNRRDDEINALRAWIHREVNGCNLKTHIAAGLAIAGCEEFARIKELNNLRTELAALKGEK